MAFCLLLDPRKVKGRRARGKHQTPKFAEVETLSLRHVRRGEGGKRLQRTTTPPPSSAESSSGTGCIGSDAAQQQRLPRPPLPPGAQLLAAVSTGFRRNLRKNKLKSVRNISPLQNLGSPGARHSQGHQRGLSLENGGKDASG